MANNLFTKAKTDPVFVPKKKRGEKEEIFIGENLDIYSAIDTMEETLKGAKKLYRNLIVSDMVNFFIEETLASKTRPNNFRGFGDLSEASCEMRKKSSSVALSITELKVLKQYDISTETVITTPASNEKYFFSQEVMDLIENKPSVANQISAALSKIPALKGVEILRREAPCTEESIEVVCDETFMDAARNIKDADTLKQIYGIIGTPSIKPKMTTNDFGIVLNILKKAGINLSSSKKNNK